MRCMMFSMRRSVCNSERTLPVTIMAMSPFFTREPSPMSTSTCMVGSKRRNTSLAISTPARMPSSLMSRCDLPIASSGIQHNVVWSPSPISSANDRSMSLSTSSSTLNINQLFYDILICILEKIDTDTNTKAYGAVILVVLKRLLVIELGLDGHRAVDEE